RFDQQGSRPETSLTPQTEDTADNWLPRPHAADRGALIPASGDHRAAVAALGPAVRCGNSQVPRAGAVRAVLAVCVRGARSEAEVSWRDAVARLAVGAESAGGARSAPGRAQRRRAFQRPAHLPAIAVGPVDAPGRPVGIAGIGIVRRAVA